MRTPWHVLWGSGNGVLRKLAPQTRLVCATAAVAACLVPSVISPPGLSAVAAVVILWLLLCRPPAAVVRSAMALGLVMLGPVLLLTPLIHARSSVAGWGAAAAAPWTVLARGLACMLVTVAAASTLTPTELRQGLVRLPVPRLVTLILLQVVQQTATLLGETRRVATAVTVRGGRLGTAAGLRLLGSLPTVWMPRIVSRAERVAIAMELRGAAEVELEALGAVSARRVDALAVVAAALVVSGAVALRLWSGP
jgi:energy-coupling factor transporter transmembrane protein EcfT